MGQFPSDNQNVPCYNNSLPIPQPNFGSAIQQLSQFSSSSSQYGAPVSDYSNGSFGFNENNAGSFSQAYKNSNWEYLAQGGQYSYDDLMEFLAMEKMSKLDESIYNGLNWLNLENPKPKTKTPSDFSSDFIYSIARDPNGCRWLKMTFEEGNRDNIEMIFNAIAGHSVELMMNPFGNFVFQKLLDVCDEKQRLEIVMNVTQSPGLLVRLCLNTYGIRAVQKLIETLSTSQQFSLVILALTPGFLELVKDQNGNNVIQQCLHWPDQYQKFIYDGATRFCVEVATNIYGCYVMQQCIQQSIGRSREKLLAEIFKNALLLSQDPFGNYVILYIIELKRPSDVTNLLSQLKGHYVMLSMQRFGNLVVEKCLHHLEESHDPIVNELISVMPFENLVQHPYASNVIQSALKFTKGGLQWSMANAVQYHTVLRTNPYG